MNDLDVSSVRTFCACVRVDCVVTHKQYRFFVTWLYLNSSNLIMASIYQIFYTIYFSSAFSLINKSLYYSDFNTYFAIGKTNVTR